MMQATTDLMKEHRGIELMLRVLGAISARAGAGEALDTGELDGILEFLTVFADKCHHGKEEDILFPALEAVGIQRSHGPIGVMLLEHTEGRAIIKRLKDAVAEYKAGDRTAANRIASAGDDYAALLSQHIQKEDKVLYPMGDERLTPEKDAELVAAFEEIERERIGPSRHEEFHAMLHRLEAKYLKG
ncbi:MAG: iron-sulfur cluster repair di-iron protein [Candidatus Latescibacteria bacterium ADurb.Bin168]|nr:MAG: iron-sulfur cluster repair di-iron protein [Candidatus Latescibacteria bacterium ADurb.Bin168]